MSCKFSLILIKRNKYSACVNGWLHIDIFAARKKSFMPHFVLRRKKAAARSVYNESDYEIQEKVHSNNPWSLYDPVHSNTLWSLYDPVHTLWSLYNPVHASGISVSCLHRCNIVPIPIPLKDSPIPAALQPCPYIIQSQNPTERFSNPCCSTTLSLISSHSPT